MQTNVFILTFSIYILLIRKIYPIFYWFHMTSFYLDLFYGVDCFNIGLSKSLTGNSVFGGSLELLAGWFPPNNL